MDITTFDATYTKNEQGLLVLKLAEAPLPADYPPIAYQYLICIDPGGFGGNHKHARREAFVAVGEGLYMIWQDEQGQRHEVSMSPPSPGKLQLFVTRPWTPHIIQNSSQTSIGVLYEARDVDSGDLQPLEGAESLRSSVITKG